MTDYDRLDLLFQQNNGIVKTAQVLENGIAKIPSNIIVLVPVSNAHCLFKFAPIGLQK